MKKVPFRIAPDRQVYWIMLNEFINNQGKTIQEIIELLKFSTSTKTDFNITVKKLLEVYNLYFERETPSKIR